MRELCLARIRKYNKGKNFPKYQAIKIKYKKHY